MTDFNPDDENDLAQELPDENDILTEEDNEDDSLEEESTEVKSEERLETLPKGKKISKDSEDDDDENELRLPDDAEADLLTILESKIHAESKEEEEEEASSNESSDSTDELLLIPRQINEQHCQKCWLLVRKNAPKCPVHEDDCPIFTSVG